MALSREQLIEASKTPDVATEDVEIPGLGSVTVREMSGTLRNRVESWGASENRDAKTMESLNVAMLAGCVLDDEGTPVGDEIARGLFKHRPRDAYRLRARVFKLSALDQDDHEELKEGFGDDPSDGSTSV